LIVRGGGAIVRSSHADVSTFFLPRGARVAGNNASAAADVTDVTWHGRPHVTATMASCACADDVGIDL